MKMLALSPSKMCTVTRLRASNSSDEKQRMFFLSLLYRQPAQDRILCAELPHSQNQGGMKSCFNIACVWVRALTKSRSGSLELSPRKESLLLLGAKETQGSFEKIRCHNEFKQNQLVTELLCANPEACSFYFIPWEYLWELFAFNYTPPICHSKLVEFRQL